MFSEPFNASFNTNSATSGSAFANSIINPNPNTQPIASSSTAYPNFNYCHRASVGSIPSLSSSVTQSNESLRFVPSNESLRIARSNDSLRIARSNESLRYTNSNESIRKAFTSGNNAASIGKPFSVIDEHGFGNFRASNSNNSNVNTNNFQPQNGFQQLRQPQQLQQSQQLQLTPQSSSVHLQSQLQQQLNDLRQFQQQNNYFPNNIDIQHSNHQPNSYLQAFENNTHSGNNNFNNTNINASNNGFVNGLSYIVNDTNAELDNIFSNSSSITTSPTNYNDYRKSSIVSMNNNFFSAPSPAPSPAPTVPAAPIPAVSSQYLVQEPHAQSPPLNFDQYQAVRTQAQNLQFIDNDISQELNQYSFNDQFLNQTTPKSHKIAASMGTINDYRNVSNYHDAQPQQPKPQLRSVGSFKDLKNGIINESLIDKRSVSSVVGQQHNILNTDNINYFNHNSLSNNNNNKHHYFKSQSVNLSNQYQPSNQLKKDEANRLINLDNLIAGLNNKNGHVPANSLAVDDLNFAGLYIDGGSPRQIHSTVPSCPPNYSSSPNSSISSGSHGNISLSNTSNSSSNNNNNNSSNNRPNNGRRKSDVRKEESSKKASEKDLFNKYKNIPFDQLESKVLKLSTDQNGCRFLQRKLEEDGSERPLVIDTIYKQVKPNIYELVIDPFGNYLIQKIFEFISDEQRTELIKLCSGRFDEISLNQHGTRALQKMIEYVTTQEQTDLIINNLANHVVRLIKDLNGNHVIQKCLYKFSPENCQFVIDGICQSVVEVATHRHGCCVLQKCLDRSNDGQFVELGHEILKNGLVLMQDPFGNYVIQYLLPKKQHDLNPNFAEIIGKQIIGRLEDLSIQKFASNVVEKCLKYLNDAILRNILVEEILSFNNLESVLKDPYGNYVVQTALEVATGTLRDKAIDKIGALMPFVKNTPYARKIQQRLSEAETQVKKDEFQQQQQQQQQQQTQRQL